MGKFSGDQLPLDAVTALHAHTYRYLFGMLIFEGAKVSVGSGVGVRIGDRYFIATAGHNLAGVDDRSLPLVHEAAVSSRVTPFARRWPGPSDPSPMPDVGYIELDRPVALDSPKEFLPLDRLSPQWSHRRGNVLLSGHPATQVPQNLIAQRLINMRAFGFTTETVPLPPSCDPGVDIALEWRKTAVQVHDGQALETPDPCGMSGGGLWTFPPVRPSSVWSAESSLLVGLDRAWLRKSRTVLCTQLVHWLNLVARHYPDLQSVIHRHTSTPRATG